MFRKLIGAVTFLLFAFPFGAMAMPSASMGKSNAIQCANLLLNRPAEQRRDALTVSRAAKLLSGLPAPLAQENYSIVIELAQPYQPTNIISELQTNLNEAISRIKELANAVGAIPLEDVTYFYEDDQTLNFTIAGSAKSASAFLESYSKKVHNSGVARIRILGVGGIESHRLNLPTFPIRGVANEEFERGVESAVASAMRGQSMILLHYRTDESGLHLVNTRSLVFVTKNLADEVQTMPRINSYPVRNVTELKDLWLDVVEHLHSRQAIAILDREKIGIIDFELASKMDYTLPIPTWLRELRRVDPQIFQSLQQLARLMESKKAPRARRSAPKTEPTEARAPSTKPKLPLKINYETSIDQAELLEFQKHSKLIAKYMPGFTRRTADGFHEWIAQIDMAPAAREHLQREINSIGLLAQDINNMATVTPSALRIHHALLAVALYSNAFGRELSEFKTDALHKRTNLEWLLATGHRGLPSFISLANLEKFRGALTSNEINMAYEDWEKNRSARKLIERLARAAEKRVGIDADAAIKLANSDLPVTTGINVFTRQGPLRKMYKAMYLLALTVKDKLIRSGKTPDYSLNRLYEPSQLRNFIRQIEFPPEP